ncbi:MAG: ComEC/Rec2 family competence protein [Chlamydiota bacterium]
MLAKSYLNTLSSSLALFWKKAPALEISFYLLIGASFALTHFWITLIVGSIFIYLKTYQLMSGKNHFLIQTTLLCTLGYGYMLHFKPPLITTAVKGSGVIKILEKRPTVFFGRSSIYYKALLTCFETEDHIVYKNIPCTLRLKPKNAYEANKDLVLHHITLAPTASGLYQLKLDKDSQISPIKNSFSLAEHRYKWKLKVTKHLNHYIKESKTLKLLTALSVGYLDNKTLNYEFSKLGLQHLLTISGFHFALLALFFSWILQPLLPKKAKCLILILLLGTYMLYLGPAPSVSRAWIGVLIYLIGDFFDIASSGLNALGIACLCSFLIDPLCITQIGFQLSYSATLGIVAFYAPCEKLLCYLTPKRSLIELVQMPMYQSLLTGVLNFLRKGLALDLAVNLLTGPLLFFHFGSYPLMSFFYNLFIPVLISFSLLLLLVAYFFAWISPLCGWIHHINEVYTSHILTLIATSPKALDISIHLPFISYELCIATLCTVTLSMVFLSFRTKELS